MFKNIHPSKSEIQFQNPKNPASLTVELRLETSIHGEAVSVQATKRRQGCIICVRAYKQLQKPFQALLCALPISSQCFKRRGRELCLSYFGGFQTCP
jgi:hypothetical protein